MDTPKRQAIPTEKDNPGYETRDVNLRLIMASLIGLSILIVVALLLMWGMFRFLANRQASLNVPLSPLAGSQQPPEPRLQASPAQELQQLRAEEDEILNSYGWVNKEAEVVRIPIERAMELTLERGLPTAPQN